MTGPHLALVVDDSAAMRRQLRQSLERAGLEVEEAADGAEAFRKLRGTRADVILTDINMPVLDGLKLIALVRSGGDHQRTPIVVISTEGAQADIDRARGLGANAYLVKPIQSGQLVELVKELLAGAG